MTKPIETAEVTNVVATSTAVAPSSNLFPLTSDEHKKISEIAAELCPNGKDSADRMRVAIDELCPNVAVMQQHAVEASKLLTVTDARLKEYENAGFFKRLWYRISGKTGSMERANQRDLVTMQKLAWWYLTELQRQNLLQARAIVVIRNNLKDLGKRTSEIYGLIELLQKRVENRLDNLEYSLEEIKWVVYLDGRKTEFPDSKKYPVICALQIVFDYLKTFRDFAKKRRDERIWSEPLDIIAPVRSALAKFGIVDKFGLRQCYTVHDFIRALLVEEQTYKDEREKKDGREKIDEITRLYDCLDDHRAIKYEYALKTVKGIGFDALYRYNELMNNSRPFVAKLKKDKPETITREVVAQMMVNAPKTKYSIVDLASEIIGGCQIVMEVFNAERPKQEAAAESVRELPSPKQVEKCDEEVTDDDGSKTGVMSVCLQDVCGTPGNLKPGAKFHINKEKVKVMLGDSYLTDYLPDGVSVDVDEDGDWKLPEEEGKIVFKKGSRDVDKSKLGDNPSALDLDLKGDGHFEGSFKVYQVTGHEVDGKKFTVYGVMVGDVGYGMAYGQDGIGAFAVMVG